MNEKTLNKQLVTLKKEDCNVGKDIKENLITAGKCPARLCK